MLLEFQRDFAAAIGSPADGPMRIYRNTVLSGCVEALRDNYPAVARLLGDEMFDAIAVEYAESFPPLRPVLAFYGDHFSDWLTEQPWIGELGYLPEVARVERLYIEALFACDDEPLNLAAISERRDWLALRLLMHPAARLSWLKTPAASIWQSQRSEVEGDLELDWEPEGLLFTRPHLHIQSVRLDRAGHRFLFGLRSGETVGDAAIATTALYPSTDIGSLFTSLVTVGAFSARSHRSLS